MKKIKLLLIAGAAWLLAAQADAQITARYVRLQQNGTTAINLAEIRAIQNGTGTNLALNKTVTTSSNHACCTTANYVDGSIPSFGATDGGGTAEFVEVDLGAEYELDEIQIVNRQDCCQDRAVNLQLILKNGAGTQVYSLPINAYQGQNSAFQTNWSLVGAALNFDGDNDFVQLPAVLPFGATSFTFEATVKAPTVGTGGLSSGERVGILLGNHNNGVNPDFNFEINASGRVRIYWDNGAIDAVGTSDLRDNQWHHVAFVRDIAQNKFFAYVDGNLEINHSSAGTNTTIATTHRLGADNRTGDSPNFHGSMDEARIWNTARSQNQIQHFKECELTGTEAGLHSYYQFNQSSGTVLSDTTANANDGTLTNFALLGGGSNWVASGGVASGSICTAASALAFDGSDDYVEIPNDPGFVPTTTQAVTFEAWINPASSNNGIIAAIYNHGNAGASNFYIIKNSTNKIFITGDGTNTLTSNGAVPLNSWSHIAIVFKENDGSDQTKIYINGVLDLTGDLNYNGANGGQSLRLGIEENIGDKFTGKMDEIRLWGKDLSQAEIQGTMNCELIGTETDLEAYYRFNQGIVGVNNAWATTLTDASPNANNGTLNNFALAGTSSNWVAPGGVISEETCFQASISGQTTACDSTVLAVIGGSSYEWSTGATTAEITVTTSGTYTVTVTENGATVFASVEVTIHPAPPAPTLAGTTTACDSVTLTASVGNNYFWSSGDTTAVATFTESGIYTVSYADTNGCVASAADTITVNKAIAAITGDATGCDEVELTASGGSLYLWTGGATGTTASFDAPGTYSVTVTDGNGCTDEAMHTIIIVNQSRTYYLDGDGDGYGNSANPVLSCTPLAGYISLGLDCDDTDPTINPGAVEVCDQIDNNCNGILIETACGGSDAPVSDACASRSTVEVLNGQVFFNYGSVTDAINTYQSSSFTIGQPVVDFSITGGLNVGFGFWTRFLLAPSAPVVMATEGDLPDRVEINWSADPLSPNANSYKLYRDGALLATVDNETFAFIDFNVLAGQFYTYEVAGVNQFGEGGRGSALGFLNPNGVVTGQVKTFSGNPVVGAVVELTPTLGTALDFDGISTAFAEYEPAFPREEFTVSCWVKIADGNPTDEPTGIYDFGSTLGKNWWLHAVTPADGSKGYRFGIGKNLTTRTEIDFTLPDATKNDWHYVAASYNGSALLLYVDGELVETAVGEIEADSTVLFLGKRSDEGGYFRGKIDEMRLFNRQLPQTEIQMAMNQAISGSTDGLVAYWKFDEGTGSKGFDISPNRTKMHLCGARWANDKPAVINAGLSDETGFYKIEGVNYAAGQTFTATPYKDFHFNQSLEFNAANQTYATLTDFDLADSTTIEVTVKNFDFSAAQTILSKQNGGTTHFNLGMNAGNLVLEMGGTTHNFGSLGMGFHRLSFRIHQTGSSAVVEFYKNGTLAGTQSFSGVAADFSGGTPWTLGARRNGGSFGQYFTGLIDEAAFFSTLLSVADIQAAANIGTDVSHTALSVYFNLNEGERTVLHDMGNTLTGEGTLYGASWSTVAAIEQRLAHEFTPSSRLVTLNPSNTSADQIDFTDQSTVPVSGYVRFDNTNCFQKGVEILVNGLSVVPQVFTDVNGKFIVDVEPGKDVRLTPKFEQHTFYPAFWDLENLASPVSGILFRNQTTRKVVGQVAGNETCRKSVVPAGAIVKVKLATLNGCFEREVQLEANGKFTFNGVPADSVTVAITEHSNPVIYTFFQNLGGATLDLMMQDDTVDFIYLAPPQVEMSPLDTNLCGGPMLDIAQQAQVTIKVFEEYDGGVCYLDTAMLTIDNDISDLDQFDTLMTGGQLKYKFKAGTPNIVAPYLKTLQVTAEAHDELATLAQSAVVLGKRARQTQFTSTSPELPTLILRDPPGDASFSYLEKGETTCNSWSFTASSAIDESANLNVSLGPDLTTSVGFIAETELEVDATLDIGFEHTGTFNSLVTNEMETCVTTTEVISTSDGDLIVGSEMGGDVYMGGAINLLFGISDNLIFDTLTCSYLLDKGLIVVPEGFATTFIYTEYHILTSVIPDLLTLGDTTSAQRWQDIVDRNNLLKEESVFSENLSFDAGVVYEKSQTIETSKSITYEYTQEFSNTFSGAYGIQVNGIGVVAGASIGFTIGSTETNTNTEQTSRTVGFTLADDDLGDNFTVNVRQDRVYGTPVFELVSGQTACPWEPGSQPREEVQISIDKNVEVNVPENDVAVFTVNLGNSSQSGETGFYFLELVPESNPDGATMAANGVDIAGGVLYQIPPEQSLPLTVTIGRGPVAYEYQNLRIAARSGCEFDRAIAIGIPRDSIDEKFHKEVLVDVFYLEPCSPIDVGFPLEGWVVTPGDGNTINITINSYDVDDPDLELVRVQWRRTNGDGAWINIAELDKAALGPVFTIVPWDIATLQDGLYEIRAVTQCFSGALNPGISHVIGGKIERTPPEVFGTPQPADGVLSPQDEISITFNEPIRCDLLIQADFFQNNNVGLYNTRTDELVDAIVTCSGDKITIVPNVPNMFIENEILRVEVDNISDLAGNVFDHTSWEFFVDRNSLRWAGPGIEEVIYEGNALTVSREIENVSGAAVNYAITGIPEWVQVLPADGTLAPGTTQVVTFKFDETLPRGEYLDTLFLETALGDEPLVLDVRVICEGPEWEIDPSQFNFTMNFTVELDIEGEVSEDNMDQVAAFVGSELRGTAYLQYEPAVDKYLAFLTVYSNSVTGETLDFQIWDADMCLLYGEVVESFTFSLDGLVGSPLVPQVLHTNNQLLRKIPVHPGWNWISFNLDAPDKGIGPMLSSLQHPEGGLVKSQSQFSQYHTGLSQWLGSLTTLGYKSMYQYQAPQHDTILLVGARILPDTVNIPVNVGWNWIGYLPNTAMHPDEALASLTPLNGDVVKSQTSFAQFVAGQGWIGNLDFLSVPNGYLLKISNPGVLSYPQQSGGTVPGSAGMLAAGGLPQRDLEDGGTSFLTPDGPSATIWTVDPALFEHSMNMVAVVGADANLLEAGDVVGAFAGDEVRGGSEAVFVEPLQAWLVFLTAYANTEGETLTFKYYDASAEDIHRLNETVVFAADQVAGSVEAPQVLTLQEAGTATEEALRGNWLEAYPNPAGDHLFAAFGAAGSGTATVRITDSMGRTVKLVEVETVPGLNVARWDCAGAAGGSYFVTVTSGGNTVTKRVVKK